MTSLDGTLGARFDLKANRAAMKRWNLVILGDGYLASQEALFRQRAQQFVAVLQAKAPFGRYWNAINIYGVHVASDEAGATNGERRNGSWDRKTYFDARFATRDRTDPLRRLLTVDPMTAWLAAEMRVPRRTQVLVLVNHLDYGGSGVAGVAVASAEPRAYDIAIHEIGHAGFSLADEYVDDVPAQAPAIEPAQPNLTLNLGNLKWRAAVTPGAPIPTRAECAASVQPPFLANGAVKVGAYEGGGHARCRIYRPSAICCMRHQAHPFCDVCSEAISTVLAQHVSP